jgi:hypothetical protein
MKYLKKYKLFEEMDSSELAVYSFSKDWLFNGRAGWLESDFRIEVKSTCLSKNNKDLWVYHIKLLTDRVLSDRVWGGDGFNWDEIKDEYISYINFLKDEYKIIGYDYEYGKMLDTESVLVYFQKGKKEHKRVYRQIVPIEELNNLKLDNIIYISVYVDLDEWDDDE